MLTLSGTVWSNTGAIPSSLFFVGVNATNGAVLWSLRYAMSNGDSVEGRRHIELLPTKDLAIVGRVIHKADGHSSGFAMQIKNPMLHLSITSCDSFMVWWRQFDTEVGSDYHIVDTEFEDVLPRIYVDNAGITPGDIAVVGTAQAKHSSTLIRDVLWMETATPNGLGPGHSYSNTPDGVHFCTDFTQDSTCDGVSLSVTELTPKEVDEFWTDTTPMDQTADTNAKVCYNVVDFTTTNLNETSHAKRAEFDPVVYRGALHNRCDLSTQVVDTKNNMLLRVVLEDATSASLSIRNAIGGLVYSAPQAILSRGMHVLPIETSGLSDGAYFLKMTTSTSTFTFPFLVLR